MKRGQVQARQDTQDVQHSQETYKCLQSEQIRLNIKTECSLEMSEDVTCLDRWTDRDMLDRNTGRQDRGTCWWRSEFVGTGH